MEINNFYGRNDIEGVVFNLFNLIEVQAIFDYCKPPCVKMDITLERVVHETQMVGKSVVDIHWPTTVKVKTTAYSFDKFALIVELGSSLGLWLGLSALSFLDVVLLCFKKRSLLYKSWCSRC